MHTMWVVSLLFYPGGGGMLYNASDIAKYIISYCSSKNMPISNLKLQKVLYFTWVDYYRETGTALFLDEICAWQLGPVVPDGYYDYCSYGGRPIYLTYNGIEDERSERDEAILNKIIERYLDTPASTLVNRTHRPGTAWDCIYDGGAGNRDVIPFSLIRDKECRR